MRRWLIRISLTLVMIVMGIAVVGAIYYRQASRVPEWYAAARKSQIDHSPTIDKRLGPLATWASKTRAGVIKTDDERTHTLVLTGDEINALIGSFGQATGLEDNIAEHATGIRVRVADGQITIAAELVQYKKVASVVLAPALGTDGYAALKLASFQMGNARVPLVAFDGQQEQLESFVGRLAARSQSRVAIDEHGEATGATASLYYASLASDLFAGKTVDAYAFVAHDLLNVNDRSNPLATRVREIKIEDDKLIVTLEALTPLQREELVTRLKSLGEKPADTPKQ